MSIALIDERDLLEAASRSTLYSLLAAGLGWPTVEKMSALESILLPTAAALSLEGSLRTALAACDRSSLSDMKALRSAHILLFPPVSSQDVPGYETAYRGEGVFQQSALLADIAGFYRAHGLRAGGSDRERLDHITVELEFMALIARKEVFALQMEGPEEVEVCGQTARDFLQNHLACWAPAFGRRAAQVSAHPWYQAIGELLATWVEADAAAYEVIPVEMTDQPLPQEPPDDGQCGPCPIPTGGSS
jgi:DMSO reductase family type II enzyme chaperone